MMYIGAWLLVSWGCVLGAWLGVSWSVAGGCLVMYIGVWLLVSWDIVRRSTRVFSEVPLCDRETARLLITLYSALKLLCTVYIVQCT